MPNNYRILVINPKSTTTLVSIFQNEVCIFKQTLDHRKNTDANNIDVIADIQLRKTAILEMLRSTSINLSKVAAVCSNGGIVRPVEGGTYLINEAMIHDLTNDFNGKHASNLGGLIAYEIANGLNVPAYIVDPPVVDELNEIARFSGLPKLERKSIFHALNQKYVARKAARELKVDYQQTNLIVAHLGNGITIGAHQNGRVIDVNNGLHGDGPFSLERTGTIPLEGLITLCFSGKYTKESMMHAITYHGGLNAYLHTNDIGEIEKRIEEYDSHAEAVFDAMSYQIAKELGSMAVVLEGKVDGIVLTGELANSKLLTKFIMSKVAWIADVFVYPGEYDVQALNEGTLRVLRAEELPKEYVINEGGRDK